MHSVCFNLFTITYPKMKFTVYYIKASVLINQKYEGTLPFQSF
jgi:hypothetical protein